MEGFPWMSGALLPVSGDEAGIKPGKIEETGACSGFCVNGVGSALQNVELRWNLILMLFSSF
jgi:hypothetical protein